MIFNGDPNGYDIIDEIDRYIGVNGLSIAEQRINGLLLYPLFKKVNAVNKIMRELYLNIFRSYDGWRFVDMNINGTGEAILDLVEGQSDYNIPTLAKTIIGLDYKQQNSVSGSINPIWVPIEAQSVDKIRKDLGISEGSIYTKDGVPIIYTLQKNIIRLYPAPNYSQLQSLRVVFNPDIYTFTTTDTNKEPGFDSLFHPLLAIGAALEYAQIASVENKGQLQAIYDRGIQDMKEFYSKRFVDKTLPKLQISNPLTDYS